ncbi:protein of unknown function [Burkholderia multivorans]
MRPLAGVCPLAARARARQLARRATAARAGSRPARRLRDGRRDGRRRAARRAHLRRVVAHRLHACVARRLLAAVIARAGRLQPAVPFFQPHFFH